MYLNNALKTFIMDYTSSTASLKINSYSKEQHKQTNMNNCPE